MDVALCHPIVLPDRGGCETYIVDLARRLARDGYGVHLLASRWDAAALPPGTHFHRIDHYGGPRWLRPWRFAAACERALRTIRHDVSIGFDKTWGQDVLYPQGGLHRAAAWHNLLKYTSPVSRHAAWIGKILDPSYWSYRLLERKQYLASKRSAIVVNSEMVRRHFEEFYGIPPETIHVLRSAIDPARFRADDRFTRRHQERQRWGIAPDVPVGLFVGMNYRLKGLEPLLRALPAHAHLAVIGHADFSRYARLAQVLGVAGRVRFLGHRADPKDAYFAADYLVHPTFYDPCSLVVLEALACGLPVVTTPYNGASELLDEHCGLVVSDPHNRAELGSAIRRISDPGFRSRAAMAARVAASAWTFEHHYRGLLQICKDQQALRRAA